MAETLNVNMITIPLGDTASDWQGNNVVGALLRAPSASHGGGITILAAYGVNGAATGAGTGFALQIENWDTTGTAIKSGSGGTVAAAIGGTGSPWAASTPKAFTVDNPFVAANEWLYIRKTETNSSDPSRCVVHLHYIEGK